MELLTGQNDLQNNAVYMLFFVFTIMRLLTYRRRLTKIL